MLPGSVGHPPESHHGRGDHLSQGFFYKSGVDVVLKFHSVSGDHFEGSIDSLKKKNNYFCKVPRPRVWIVPSSDKIFQ